MMKIGQIKSLHRHAEKKGGKMVEEKEQFYIAGAGLRGAPRGGQYDYRPAKMKQGEDPAWRHVSLMYRAEARKHELLIEAKLGPLPPPKSGRNIKKGEKRKRIVIKPGDYQANWELDGFLPPEILVKLLGKNLRYRALDDDRDYQYDQKDDGLNEEPGAQVIVGNFDLADASDEALHVVFKILRFPCNLVLKQIPVDTSTSIDTSGVENKKVLIKQMEDGNQGFFATVTKSGKVKVGDFLYITPETFNRFKATLSTFEKITFEKVDKDLEKLELKEEKEEVKKEVKKVVRSAAIADDD
jgi:hypothetical protein